MSADTGNETENTKKRGRIPQSAWPGIVERYRTGATLSAIAREFDCTPSAISYIIRKAEAQGVEPSGDDTETETSSEDVSAPEDTASAPEAETPKPEAPKSEAPRPAPQQTTLRLNPLPAEPKAAPRPETPPPVPAMTVPAVAPPGAATQSAPVTGTPGQAPATAAGRPEPTPPVDAVEARLRETARGCLTAYRGWRQQPGEASIQSLSEAVHELRKALARVEIDMSASRRDEQAIRPIPIPAHRASRRPQ